MAEARRRTRRSKPPKEPLPLSKSNADFWRTKSAEEIAAEQGIGPITRLEEVLGKGKHLWKSDEEFERFLADLYEQRRKDRGS